MRITGGIACGHRLAVPRTGVRPSQDRLRESLFSMLAPHIPGATVLDLFAGTGALGIEAWSRGAAAVCWIERSPAVFRVLKRNVDTICGPDTPGLRCVAGDARKPDRFAAFGPFTLVLADPPYGPGKGGIAPASFLPGLAASAMLTPGARIGIEQPASEPAFGVAGWHIERDRVLGQSRIVIYRRPLLEEEKEFV